ncbi:MAG: stage III sporulation protein AF [Bacillota bacterium]|nr:stage III sporulation protein AF [Bacillota bacterium]
MAVLQDVIRDFAIVAVLAAFVDMFLPGATKHYSIKLVFGLYFLAVLLNPVVSLFTDVDLAALDFRDLAISDMTAEEAVDDAGVLAAAASSLASEMEARLGATYEEIGFTVTVDLGSDEVKEVEVLVEAVSPGRERVMADNIKNFLAQDYGIEKDKTKVVFI